MHHIRYGFLRMAICVPLTVAVCLIPFFVFAAEDAQTSVRSETISCPKCSPLTDLGKKLDDARWSIHGRLYGEKSGGIYQELKELKRELLSYYNRLEELRKMPAQPDAADRKKFDEEIADLNKKQADCSSSIASYERLADTLEKEIKDLESRKNTLKKVMEDCEQSCKEKIGPKKSARPVENTCLFCSSEDEELGETLTETDALNASVARLEKELSSRKDRLHDIRAEETDLGNSNESDKGARPEEKMYGEAIKEYVRVLAEVYEKWIDELQDKIRDLLRDQSQALMRTEDLRRQLSACQEKCK